MAIYLLIYKTYVEYPRCLCGYSLATEYPRTQPDTQNVRQNLYLSVVCPICSEVVRLRCYLLTQSIYVPPPPPPPPPALPREYYVVGSIDLCGYTEDQREINNNDTMVGVVSGVSKVRSANKHVQERYFDSAFVNNDTMITGAPPIAP